MLRQIHYILFILLVFSISCSNEELVDTPNANKATIKLKQTGFQAMLVDGDNLESEQTVKNMTLLFTDPSSDIITHKYIDVSFSSTDDSKIVTLPIDPSELNRKDIYVIANYNNTDFSTLASLNDLKSKTTPVVDENNLLEPANGLCMYGKTLDFDFNNNTNDIAIVYAVRTSAKYRITLTFPQNSSLSTDNSFLITNIAGYTTIVDDIENDIPSGSYFDFTEAIPLEAGEENANMNVVYAYEAVQAPEIYIYTHINNSSEAQEFSAKLPIPERNYLYDIDVRVYEETDDLLRSEGKTGARYRFDVSVTPFHL